MKELSDQQFHAEVLAEYAKISNEPGYKPGAEARAEAERRVRERLKPQPQLRAKEDDTPEQNDWRKGQIWFKPGEVKEILAVGIALGIIAGLLFAIFVLFIALINRH